MTTAGVKVAYHISRFLLWVLLTCWNRLSVKGAENIPHRSGRFIIAPNHTSYLDPPIIGAALWRQMVFLAKDRLFKIPVLGLFLHSVGVMPVDTNNDAGSLRRAVKMLKSGLPITIFPEGTRAPSGDFLEGKPGIAFLAHMAQAPIVPCYISGAREAMGRGQRWIRPSKIRAIFGEPVEVRLADGEQKMDAYRRTAAEVMKRIADLKATIE
ncbi:MAG: 1-acyl-sn-glycerol-3-phosphate acyltransferase [Candidatus Omnitrophica bacterium]|nr:1-acyl-sn-glycerol-3-phosphate acyltransferase [Candidatus Omnitrophota bacterium]